MCKTPEIFIKKRDFITKYNPTRTIESALSSSITASLQRNELWEFDTSNGRKDLIKETWSEYLTSISKQYEDAVITEVEFENHFLGLKELMNSEYKIYFRTDGFKISHAQKSLSVFLKILWTQGKIKIPPLCPVDRTILVAAGERFPKPWTDVNTLAEYRRQVLILKRRLPYHPCGTLACWELSNFMPNV